MLSCHLQASVSHPWRWCLYTLGLCEVELSEIFMQLFGSQQKASNLGKPPASSSLLACPVLDWLLAIGAWFAVLNEVESLAADGFTARNWDPKVNIEQLVSVCLSGTDSDPTLAKTCPWMNFSEEGWEAKREDRAGFRMWMWYQSPARLLCPHVRNPWEDRSWLPGSMQYPTWGSPPALNLLFPPGSGGGFFHQQCKKH